MIKLLEKKPQKSKQKMALLLGKITYFSRSDQLVPGSEKRISEKS